MDIHLVDACFFGCFEAFGMGVVGHCCPTTTTSSFHTALNHVPEKADDALRRRLGSGRRLGGSLLGSCFASALSACCLPSALRSSALHTSRTSTLPGAIIGYSSTSTRHTLGCWPSEVVQRSHVALKCCNGLWGSLS